MAAFSLILLVVSNNRYYFFDGFSTGLVLRDGLGLYIAGP